MLPSRSLALINGFKHAFICHSNSTSAKMQNFPWKEASSLIIVARASDSEKIGRNLANVGVVSSKTVASEQQQKSAKPLLSDYRIMMVKRSGLSSFLASAFVFPGGIIELADYSSKWWQVFENLGVKRQELDVFSTSVFGPRPPMVTEPLTIGRVKSNDQQEYLPADIGLRIAAIRETFEETGVLLLTRPPAVSSSGNSLSQHDISPIPISDLDDVGVDLGLWRGKVRDDAGAFLELCLETGLCPDLWSLYEWSDWLTPISVGHKRCDTMFYLCCLDRQPKVALDNSEVTTLKWCTPMEMLEEHSQLKVFLAPPQVYELSRIQNLPNFLSVKEFAQKRQSQGVERWLPVISTYSDGAVSVLPGDENYPEEPDIIGKKPIPDFPHSLEDVRAKASKLNRLELRGPTCTVFCTIPLHCGHLQPMTYPPLTSAIHSLL